jgi:polar amino acid transport system permease protein
VSTEADPVTSVERGGGGDRPGRIDAVPVRHPGRWVAVVIIAILLAKLVHLLVTNPAFDWSFIFQAMVQSPVLRGLVLGTLVGTICAMVVAVALGVVLAVMRLSDNKVLSLTAWAYIWFFRAIPRYVLLFMMGALGTVFPPSRGGLGIGLPFGPQIMDALGFSGKLQLFSLDANQVFSGLVGGILGLALSEAAYMAEIARAGILSVDEGQGEAATALGLSRAQVLRRVVLPQAMRVIVPPTGNETIAMVKDTSLLIAVPVTSELFYQLTAIGARTFQPWAVGVAATIWYLIICSVLMYVQMHIERHFGRGFGGGPSTPGLRARLFGLGAGSQR